MTNRSTAQSHLRRDGVRVEHKYERLASGNSPRGPDGQLRLRANTLSHTLAEVISWRESGDYVGNNGYSANSPAAIPHSIRTVKAKRASDIAYGRLRGKLYKGNAALGVTLASWKQSADMIRSNSEIIRRQAEIVADVHSYKKISQRLASKHLEIIFGWAPLIADMQAAAFTVIQGAFPLTFVRGSGVVDFYERSIDARPGWRKEVVTLQGRVRCTQALGVRLTNPNTWLAERAGLYNPAAVAWDIVPFSFLVNMVTNVGSVINAITDFCGLSFTDGSLTTRWDLTRIIAFTETYPRVGETSQHDLMVHKERKLIGAPIGPSLIPYFRPPNVNWETAAMATSLMVQQAVPVIKLLKRLRGF